MRSSAPVAARCSASPARSQTATRPLTPTRRRTTSASTKPRRRRRRGAGIAAGQEEKETPRTDFGPRAGETLADRRRRVPAAQPAILRRYARLGVLQRPTAKRRGRSRPLPLRGLAWSTPTTPRSRPAVTKPGGVAIEVFPRCAKRLGRRRGRPASSWWRARPTATPRGSAACSTRRKARGQTAADQGRRHGQAPRRVRRPTGRLHQPRRVRTGPLSRGSRPRTLLADRHAERHLGRAAAVAHHLHDHRVRPRSEVGVRPAPSNVPRPVRVSTAVVFLPLPRVDRRPGFDSSPSGLASRSRATTPL